MAKSTPRLPKLTYRVADQRKAIARLREIILHIAHRCATAEYFGAIKLNKILAFADFTSFARYGKPITGVEYMRQPNGPVPRKMKPVIEQMKRSKDIAIQVLPIGKYEEHRVVPLRPANLDLLSPRDVAILEEVIALTWKATGQQVSDFSHGRAWEVAGENGAAIPYEAALLSDRQVSAAQIARTRELNRRFRWEAV
jgi:antitoxin SocA-like protein